ncbi:MAG: ParB protein [Acidobacteriota bacterium]|nr:ParB protein [Acidobacteriota bacterium]
MDKIIMMSVSELFFDIRNPRMVEFNELTPQTTEKRIIEILWEAMDVRELVLSIAASGYFKNEPLIVSTETGRNIVIEGNRRLAAIKVILNPELIRAEIPEVTQSIKESIREVPTMIEKREDAWRYLGFKHVNGPAKWGSYAKARYIAQVHADFRIPLEQIANQIGDTHKTVQRLYRGLMVVVQAEKEKIFSRDDAKRSYFAFSHLYTGLQYKGIGQYLNLKDENEDTKEFVPKSKLDELGELFKWLYGSEKANIEPVVQSQNPHLRQLDAIVQSREALAALRDGESIDNALELTRPASNIFEDELLKAKRSLVKAKGLVTEGYDGSESLLKIVESIGNIAYDLHEEMERKKSPRIKRISQGKG